MRTFLAQSLNNNPISGVPGGTVAIYESGPNGTDHAPAQNPRANLSRVAFHSDLDYLGVVSEHVITTTIPANGGGTTLGNITLLAHGQGVRPLVMAQYRASGSTTWKAVNGSTPLNVFTGFLMRAFTVQADATNVYIAWFQTGALNATSFDFRIQILSRAFDAPAPNTGEVFFASPANIRAAGGRFDTANGYLQTPAAGQVATTNHTSGMTLGLFDGIDADEFFLGVATDELHGNVSSKVGLGAPGSPYLGKVEVPLVHAGPTVVGAALELSPTRMRISSAGGVSLIDTARPMLAITDEMRGSLTVSPHGATINTTETVHEVIHAAQNVTAGASVILGWLEITATSGAFIQTNRPFEFSGSLFLYANNVTPPPETRARARNCVILSPRIFGGQLQIIEQYFNQAYVNPPSQNTPSIQARYHLFAAALVGGF